MRPIERYVTIIQYYSQSVTKSVVGSVKKLRVLSNCLYLAQWKSSKGFFTLRQTHFFTCDRYALDEDIPLERLRQGGANTWNTWRQSDPAILPELHGADLNGADLRAANLSGADLSGADLTDANLLGANVSGAVLNYASLPGALINDEQLSTVKSRLE
jgi:hypothetical protein